MGLQEFLFPQEEIKYQSPQPVQFMGQNHCVIYITNRRVIVHKMRGHIFKKDNVISIALQEITDLVYEEKGLPKKGVLMIHTITKIEGPFKGKPEDMKVLWREMQKYLGMYEAMGAAGTDVATSADPLQVLKTRLATGEISPEEYARLKNAMEG